MPEDQDGGSDVALQLRLKPHEIGFSSNSFSSLSRFPVSLQCKRSNLLFPAPSLLPSSTTIFLKEALLTVPETQNVLSGSAS